MVPRQAARRGLALVEVVVIAAIAGLTFALACPALLQAQIFAKREHADDHLKQLGLAAANYESANGAFPMSEVGSLDPKARGIGHSGFTALLPYMEQVVVYNAYNFDLEPWDASNNTATRTRLNVLLAPENKDIASKPAEKLSRFDGRVIPGKNAFGPLHFGMNWGGGREGFGDDFVKEKGKYRGVFMKVIDAEGEKAGAHNIRMADIIDGTSFTLGFVEKRDSAGWAIGGFGGSEFDVHTSPAYEGDDAKAKAALTGTVTGGGPRAALVDGSVRTIIPKMSKQIWYALLTRDGAEAINPFEQ